MPQRASLSSTWKVNHKASDFCYLLTLKGKHSKSHTDPKPYLVRIPSVTFNIFPINWLVSIWTKSTEIPALPNPSPKNFHKSVIETNLFVFEVLGFLRPFASLKLINVSESNREKAGTIFLFFRKVHVAKEVCNSARESWTNWESWTWTLLEMIRISSSWHALSLPAPTPARPHPCILPPLFIPLQRELRNNLQIFDCCFPATSKVGTSVADLKSRCIFKGTLPKCQLYLRLRHGSV